MNIDETLEQIGRLKSEMAALEAEHPVPIALSFTRQGYSAFADKLHITVGRQPESIASLLGIKSLPPLYPEVGSIPVYVWNRQPVPCKAYYSKQDFFQWFSVFSDPGDSIAVSLRPEL